MTPAEGLQQVVPTRTGLLVRVGNARGCGNVMGSGTLGPEGATIEDRAGKAGPGRAGAGASAV